MENLDSYLPAIVAGDVQAFGHWMARAEPRLRASLRPVARKVDAEAVLQEALLRTWQSAPTFRADGQPDALLRLAQRIAHNLAVSELRKKRPEPGQLDELERTLASAGAFAHPTETDPLLRRHVVECREKLPNKPALALAQRLDAHGGEPDSVLAARVSMTLNTFLQNFTRARKLLADCLQKRGVDLSSVLP